QSRHRRARRRRHQADALHDVRPRTRLQAGARAAPPQEGPDRSALFAGAVRAAEDAGGRSPERPGGRAARRAARRARGVGRRGAGGRSRRRRAAACDGQWRLGGARGRRRLRRRRGRSERTERQRHWPRRAVVDASASHSRAVAAHGERAAAVASAARLHDSPARRTWGATAVGPRRRTERQHRARAERPWRTWRAWRAWRAWRPRWTWTGRRARARRRAEPSPRRWPAWRTGARRRPSRRRRTGAPFAMSTMQGMHGLVIGVANKRSIAWAIAQKASEAGARLALTYQGERLEENVRGLATELTDPLVLPCDVTSDTQIDDLFSSIDREFGGLDFVVHGAAFAPREELMAPFVETSREGFRMALDISAYSLVAVSKRALPLMERKGGGSIITLTYLGSERVLPNYNVMGVAKAALEASVRYLASDLGPKNIRVNAISAGPIKTLAASGISGFSNILQIYRERA